MGRSTDKETRLSEQRKYRSWSAQQKLEIVLAGLRGDRSVREVCREHAISEKLYYGWRDQLLEAGKERFAGKEERQGERELRRKVAELERALGRKTYERRKRPGFFRVERPRQLWQLDMTSVWVAEHGWCYLNAIIDCCTREIVAWQLELRCRADEAIAVIERAAAVQGIEEGE